jgi:Fic family protein
MTYERITDLPSDFSSEEAESAEALGESWKERYQEIKNSEALTEFNEKLYRSWAIETGIIERLYTIDHGTTRLLVERGLDSSLIAHGSTDKAPEYVIALLRSHRSAIDAILDQILQNQGLTLFFIRSLHQVMTQHQDFVEGIDQFGNPTRLPLLRGDWKKQPNNPTRSDNIVHEYCPPHLVTEEMETLFELYQRLEKRGIKPIVRSAWLHHRFTQIHPFQDGNGRIARALSAFVLVQGGLFPVVINRDDRPRYIEALEQADAGDLKPLVSLWCSVESHEITRGLSIADDVEPAGLPGTRPTPLQIIAAAGDRLQQLRIQAEVAKRQVLVTADKVHTATIDYANDIVAALNQQFSKNDPTYRAELEISSNFTRHWFHQQVVEVARKHDYFADLTTYHKWLRIKIQSDRRYEVTLSVHGLGRNFSGTMAVTGYFAERSLDENNISIVSEPKPIFDDAFVFTYHESVNDVLRRFAGWLEYSMTIAMETWRNQL